MISCGLGILKYLQSSVQTYKQVCNKNGALWSNHKLNSSKNYGSKE